uniref:Peptidase M14 domain-containing protein n=1 Tax=Attheya septentrionalis TaxID=420275 RepID=A0A7S2UH09_9STRA|mmetsp:Transcript_22904/g.41373  ORF Transcript_22904/g.41373 Transcript_22904/m.41373 type:complete len:704 (+) Transcript_22904:240-2351(+)
MMVCMFRLLVGALLYTRSLSMLRGAESNKYLTNNETYPVDTQEPHASSIRRRTSAVQYSILSAEEIANRLKAMASKYPNLAVLTSAQELYRLPIAGKESDCQFDRDLFAMGCKNYILTIEDQVAHPVGSPTWKALPEVLFSGALHGDERVGPTIAIESAEILLEAAACEAKPNRKIANKNSPILWRLELQSAASCRSELASRGILDAERKWLARLVATRRIVIVPTANALGYDQNIREENGLDPNRDFPFDLQKSEACMQTIAGRTMNELFRTHMFQLALSFHAGVKSISYEWGATSYAGTTGTNLSPDHEAQVQLAGAYSRYGGAFGNDPEYKYGTHNDMVYSIRGGMEDWAYAASWDKSKTSSCNPSTYGGYKQEQTLYDDGMFRSFNFLVETGNNKSPSRNLGSNMEVLNSMGVGNGHIPRNIRLSLLAVDMVEPYVSIKSVGGIEVSDDIAPLAKNVDGGCWQEKSFSIPEGKAEIVIEWSVGGAFNVDRTSIVYGKRSDAPELSNCVSHPESIRLNAAFTSSGDFSGNGKFHDNGQNFGNLSTGSIFTTKVDTSKLVEGDSIVVFAMAQVDSSWSNQPADIDPQRPPQSHVVNARTNPDWEYKLTKTNGKVVKGRRDEKVVKVVKGRRDWYSVPVTIAIGASTSQTLEVGSRFDIKIVRGGTKRKRRRRRRPRRRRWKRRERKPDSRDGNRQLYPSNV